jgi:hypothetical protein
MVGAWYGQNAWLTQNPLYPLHLEALGRVWLAGWYGPGAMQLSQYYISPGDWRALADILLAVFDPRLFPFWAAALAGGWAIGRRPSREDLYVWTFSALAAANIAAYWLLVPYRTQQRFMLQAIGLMVVPLARLLDRARVLRLVAAGLLVVHVFLAQGWPFGPTDREPPWDFTPRVPNVVFPLIAFPYLSKVNRGVLPDPDDVSWTVAILGLGVASMAAAWLWSRPGRRARRQACVGSVVLLGLAVAVEYPFGTDPRALFYPQFPDYFRGWLQLDASSDRSTGTRIAYAGTNLPYYLLGRGLRNEVHYVNVDAHRGWLMHDYHRQARRESHAATWENPWPAWDRLHADYDAWLANLRAEGIELLVVASMRRPRGALPDADPEGFPIERRWAESHPESFEPVYGLAERDSKFRIFRVRSASGLPNRSPGNHFDDSATDFGRSAH